MTTQSTMKATMTENSVFDRVRVLIIEILDADPNMVTEGAELVADLGADSLDDIEMIMAAEQEFGVVIPDKDAEAVITVRDAVRLIEKALGQ